MGSTAPVITMAEVARHNVKEDSWIVVDGNAYDITQFALRHPGGRRVIRHYSGEDATDAFNAFHTNRELVRKYMKPLLKGPVVDYQPSEIQKDFRALRELAEKDGMFKPKLWFYAAHFAHIVIIIAAAWATLAYGPNSGFGYAASFVTAALLLTVAQAQAGWLQHDMGHLSVFPTQRAGHLAHRIVICLIKGASARWWSFRHFQHHAKPNVVVKDPDITLPWVFLLGKKLPVEWGQKKRGFMPYHKQHHYFHLLGPALLLPTYFHYENVMYVLKTRQYQDLFFIAACFTCWHLMFAPLTGGFWGSLALYFLMRTLESHWFTWVTQMNHIPMDVDRDQRRDWLSLQVNGTCNVKPSAFNDWFTGHLNYQIEHHLFPTMPRHNYYRVQPLVQSLCKKHGLLYENKSLLGAFQDILSSLENSGQLWYKAYYESMTHQ